MATSPLFGWEEPDDVDLVKDGAAAIRTLGNAIDTSMGDLLGGTTGQVLSKTSGTDMDFTWVDTDDTNAIQNAIVDAKGDLIAASAADTPAVLAVGADGTTLVADSSTSTGLRYQATNVAGKNGVLNSNFSIWQRGTSNAITASAYVADRFCAYRGVAGSTASRQATGDTTNLAFIQYCARVQRDSGNTSTSLILFGQPFETVNSIPYAGKTVTFSFYARAGANYSAASSALAVYLNTGTGTDQNVITGSYTGNAQPINSTATLTTTWQRFTYTATLGATITELSVFFGFTPVGTAGANDFFEVTGLQLETGSVATAYSPNAATLQGELAACQRYYYRTGTNDSAAYGILTGTGWADDSTSTIAVLPLPVTMRVAPTAVDYPTLSTLRTYGYGGAQALTALTMGSQTSANFVYLDGTNTSTITAGAVQYLQKNNSATAYIGVTAEL